MRLINYIKNKIPYLVILGLLFGLTSCGSYQYVGQDGNGVYEQPNRGVEYYEESPQVANNSAYYQNYFKEKSLEYENITPEDEVFTDIDSYEGNYSAENDSLNVEYQGYAGWGQNSTDVSINVYPNYGYDYWWYRPYYAYNPWSWNYGYYGWGYPYWGYSWISGYGIASLWYPSYYGGYYSPYYYGYYSPYGSHHGYYGNHYYNRRNIAYSNGRRGTNYTTRNSSNNRNYISRNSITRNSNLETNTRRSSINSNRYNNTRTRINSNTIRRSNSSNSITRPSRTYNNSTPSSRTRSSGTISRPSRSSSSSGSISRPTRSSSSGSISRSSSSRSSSSSGTSRRGR